MDKVAILTPFFSNSRSWYTIRIDRLSHVLKSDTAIMSSHVISSIKVRSIERGFLIETLEVAKRFKLQFVDEFDEMKTLTELERVIWSLNEHE